MKNYDWPDTNVALLFGLAAPGIEGLALADPNFNSGVLEGSQSREQT